MCEWCLTVELVYSKDSYREALLMYTSNTGIVIESTNGRFFLEELILLYRGPTVVDTIRLCVQQQQSVSFFLFGLCSWNHCLEAFV